MVAVVAGGAKGLNLGSGALLGSAGVFGSSNLGRGSQGLFVNAATGNLVIQARDELVAGRGPDASLLRTYNSQGYKSDGGRSDQWTVGYSRTVRTNTTGLFTAPGASAIRRDDDGSEAVFNWDATKSLYISTDGAGAHDTLSYDSASGQWTFVDGSTRVVEVYAGNGFARLASQTDTSGNALSFAYNAAGRLSSVTTSAGEITYFDYDAQGLLGQLRTVSRSSANAGLDTTLTRVRYTYDSANRLQTVIVDLSPENNNVDDGNVFVTTYTYADPVSKRIASITDGDGATISFTYVNSKVETFTDAQGNVTRFTYTSSGGGGGYTTVHSDALVRDTIYSYDSLGQLTEVRTTLDGGAVLATSYSYNAKGDVESITDGESRVVQMLYDDWGNLLRQSDNLGNTVRRTYTAANQLLTETVATQGEPNSTTAASRFVYDGAGKSLLRFAISPEGRVTEHRYDAQGQRVATIRYALGQYPVTGLAATTVPAESTLIDWVATQDRSRTERVDYQYDWRGLLSQATTYDSVDGTGNGITDGTQAVTRYVYDPAGQLLHAYDPKNKATHYTYDGLGRVLTTTNALNQTTTSVYTATTRQVQTTSGATGLQTVSVYDQIGRLTSVQQTGTRTSTNFGQTQYFYDADDQLRMTRDATGAAQWYFYDLAGRRVGTVDAQGMLQEYVYDKSGKLTKTIDYTTAVNTAALVNGSGGPTMLSLATIRPADGLVLRASWNSYDTAGRLAKTVSPLGEVVEFSYDNAGRVVTTRHYVNTVNTASLGATPAPADIPTTQSLSDRIERHFYGYDGLLLATLDSTGGLVEYRYDAAGRATTRISHVNAAPANQIATGTLAQVTPADNESDSKTLSFYNARGQVVAELDALKYLTERVYDLNGNLSRMLRYPTQPVAGAVDPTTSLTTIRGNAGTALEEASYTYDDINRQLTRRVDPNGLNATTTYQYLDSSNTLHVVDAVGGMTDTQFDELGRARIITIDASLFGLRLQTTYTYDNLGRVKTSTDANGVTTQYDYDALGRKIRTTVDTASGGLNLITSYAYDRQGNLARVTDAKGQQTRYVYDSDNQLRYTLDAEDGLSENRYDALGNLIQTVRYATRHTGLTTTDLANGLVSHSLGSVTADAARDTFTRYAYDSEGRLRFEQNALGQVVELRYDARDQITERIEWVPTVQAAPPGLSAFWESFFTGALGTLDRSRDRVARYVYDAVGQRVYEQDALGSVDETRYDALGRVSERVRWSHRPSTTLALAASSFKLALGTLDPSTDRMARFVYDAAGRCVYDQDARGAVTEYRYDLLGRVAERVQYDYPGVSLSTSLAPATFAAALVGHMNAAVDRTTRFVYDTAGRRVYEQDALGAVVEYRYNKLGQVEERMAYAQPISTTTALTQSAFGTALTFAATPARDRLTRYVYDAAGRLAYQQDALLGVTQFRYDALGQLLERIVRANRLTTTPALTVTAFSGAVTANPSLDRATRYVYDKVGHVRFTLDALGGTVENVYDRLGQLARVIAYDTRLTYTDVGDSAAPQTVRDLLPPSTLGARETIYAYDLVGHIRYTAQSVSVAGSQKSFAISESAYDALGQLSASRVYANTRVLSGLPPVASAADVAALISADPAKDRTSQYFYFVDGRLKYTEDGEHYTEWFTYDALGNKRTYTNKNGAVVDYDYDVAGNLTEEKSPQASISVVGSNMVVEVRTLRVTSRFTYDTFGQLATRIEAQNVAEQMRTTSYEYDKLGRQLRTLYEPVGVYSSAADNTATNGANGAAVQRTESGPTALVSETAYNTFGEAVIGRDVASKFSYKTYDKLGRLINEVDGNHNVTRHAYSAIDGEYADLMRLASAADITDGWDVTAAGVDAAVDAVLSGGSRNVRTYTDRMGRMSSVQDLAGVYSYDSASATGGTWTRVNTYAYTVWGDLESKATTLNGSGGTALTRNRYDLAGRMTREINAEGYVTDYKKNAFGDNERITEFATKLTGSDLDALPASVLPSTVANASAYDRITEYTYDRRGKGIRDDKLFVQFDKRTSAGALSRVWGKVFTTYEFDGAGNLLVTGRGSQEDGGSVQDGGSSYQYYDLLGHLVLTRDAANRATSQGYDALGEVVRSTRHGNLASGGTAPGGHADDQITAQRRDKLGRVTETLEPEGLRRYFSYDAAGRVAKQWTPFSDWEGSRNAVQVFTYDAAGRQLTTKTLVQRRRTDALDYSTESAAYNAFGEATAMQCDGATIQQNFYDAGGRLWKTSSGGTTKVFWYDLQDNLTVTFSSSAADNGADLSSPTWTAPADFAPLTLANGVSRKTTTFDKLGHSTGEADSGSTHGTLRTTSASQAMDRWGNVLSVTRNGVERLRYRYNILNEVISETQVSAEVWSATGTSATLDVEKKIYYDAWGRNIGSVDGENNVNAAVYDSVGQLQTEYRADSSTVSYVYDALGRMVNKTDGIGRLYTYVYDHGNRERSRTVASGGVTYDLGSSTYDVLGRKISETTGADSAFQGKARKYDYDARGLMWRSTMPLNQATLTWYDNAGRKKTEQDANGQTASWEYTPGSGLLSFHIDLSGIRTDYSYNKLGQLKTQTSVRGQNLSYVYFEDGQLKQLSDLYRRSNTQYDYDIDGNRTREVFTNDGTVHRDLTNAYDKQGRMTNSVDVAYAGAGVPSSVPSIHEFSVRYDAVGNRRRVWGSNADDGPAGGRSPYDWWYTYDHMNRVRINASRLVNGVIKADSEFVYDGAGRRVWDWARFTGTSYQPTDMSGYRLEYAYDFADRLTERRRTMLQGQGQVLGPSAAEQSMSYNAAEGKQSEVVNWFGDGSVGQAGYFTLLGSVLYKDRLSVTQFDSNGRVASVSEKEQGFAVTIPAGLGSPATSTGQHGYVDLSQQVNTYDAAGNLSKVHTEGYSSTEPNGSRWQVYNTYRSSAFDYRYSYYLAEGYLERGQNLQGQLFNQNGSSAGFLTPTDSVQEYDANGNVAQIKRQKSNGTWTSTWYVTDNVGHIVQSWANQARYWNGVPDTVFSQDATQRIWNPDASSLSGTATAMAAMPSPALTADLVEWNKLTVLFVNDHKLGLFQAGQAWENVPRVPGDPPDDPPEQQLRSYWNGLIDVPGLGTIDRTGGSGQQHVAQAGDTASSLAQRYYGDPGLWYVIADANSQGHVNGPYAELATGTAIKIPVVTRSTNTANSFAVYQPSQIIGVTAPEAQVPPPPAAGGCGAVGMILVVAVAVVVTVYTAGAAASALGAASATSAGVVTTTAAGIGSAALGGGALTAGAAGFALGTASATAVAAAAIGGAVGSIAAQGVAMALGMQDSFNWNQVGLSAIGAGVTAGLGHTNGAFEALGKATHPYVGIAARAAVGNAVTQHLAVTTGLQEDFKWRSVVASAIAAPVTTFIGENLPPEVAKLLDPKSAGGQIAGSIVNGVVGQRIRMLVTKQGRVDYASIAADAFGNALGDSIVANMSSPTAADNRTALNRANQAADPDYYGSGTASSDAAIGGSGLTLGRNALRSWDRRVSAGITAAAAADESGGNSVSGADAVLRFEITGRRASWFDRSTYWLENMFDPTSNVYAFGASRSESSGRFEDLASTDPTGMTTGASEPVWMSDGPGIPYPTAIGNTLAATAHMYYGGAKGAVNGVPELVVGVTKGWAYIGAGLLDAYDTLAGSGSGNYLNRAIGLGSNVSGEVWAYDNGLQRMGGFAGEAASPWAYGKAVQIGGTGLTAVLDGELLGYSAGTRRAQFGGLDLGNAGTVPNVTSPFGPIRPGLEIPQGLSGAQFDRISGRVRAAADSMGLGDDIFVMGSRAGGTAKAGSDLDIGIRVTQAQFDELIASSFGNAKNARAATMEIAIRDGRIQAGEAGLSRIGRLVAKDLSFPTSKVQISVIRARGAFDNGPQSALAYTFGH